MTTLPNSPFSFMLMHQVPWWALTLVALMVIFRLPSQAQPLIRDLVGYVRKALRRIFGRPLLDRANRGGGKC
jgi:hypothetical protein